MAKCKDGEVMQVWTARTPSGFDYRQHGVEKRKFVDFDGLPLIMRPPKGK